MQHLGAPARPYGRRQRLAVDAFAQAGVDAAPGRGVDHVPRLRLSQVGRREPCRPGVVGMNLDRQITAGIQELEKQGKVSIVNLEDEYITHVEKNFDLAAIRNSGLNLVYDAMYGAGQNVMKRLFPDIRLLHCDNKIGRAHV